MSNFATKWTFMADDQIGPAVDGIRKKIGGLDSQVARHKAAFGSAMAANTRSAFSFGDGIEQIAGRVHPALGGIVSEVRKIASGLLSVKPASGMGAAASGLSALGKGAGGAASGIGGLLSSLGKLGPEAAAAAAALAIIAGGLTVATMKTAEFGHEFRQLSNLNLDKSAAEVGKLREQVLGIAFDKGIDPMAMSKGFFDFQSITGKFGAEVESTGMKIADFSKSYIVDFNKQLESTGQAMKAFGFGGETVDRFLASTVKTVQTGKTTFEQLAQVRSEYFDTAAGAGFDFEGADKLFAAYSVGAKSVDIAANQVKTTFMGLSDANVLKGLKKWGVDVFDPLTHKVRTLDQIAAGMVASFSTERMSDQAFAKIKGQIGGGDGIAMMLNKARAQGEGFLQVFRDFDATPVNMKAALAGAKKDLFTMWETTKAKLSVSLIRIGTAILPHIVSALELGNEVLDAFSGKTEGISQKAKDIVAVFKVVGQVVWNEFQKIKTIMEVALTPIFTMIDAVKWLTGQDDAPAGRRRPDAGPQVQARMAGRARPDSQALAEQLGGNHKARASGLVVSGGRSGGGGKAEGIRAAIAATAKPEPKAGRKPGYIADISDEGHKRKVNALGEVTTSNGGHVVAQGNSVRHVNVSINQLVGTLAIHAATVKESVGDITRLVERTLVGAVRNAEISIGQ